MKRRLFTILSALSLLLCVVVCVLWAASYFRWGSVIRTGIETREASGWYYRLWAVSAADGGVNVLLMGRLFDTRLADEMFQNPPGQWFVESDEPPQGYPRGNRLLRFAYTSDRSAPQRIGSGPGGYTILHTQTNSVSFPFWCVAMVLAAGGLPSVLSVMRRLRRKPGHCRHCGYDLRATPDRCPECGTVPGKKVEHS